MRAAVLTSLALLLAAPACAQEEEHLLGNLASVENVRSNPLQGTALVVGLDGTGDSTPLARRMVANMLARQGLRLTEDELNAKSVAAVLVTADLPAFARPGNRIDVTVSTLGDAKSLRGGTLLFCPLKGADGEVYATAQGSVTTGAFVFGGNRASQSSNHPTVGRVPRGAHVERAIPTPLLDGNGILRLAFKDPSYETARRVARAIEGRFKGAVQRVGGGGIELRVPIARRRRLVGFIADIEALKVKVVPQPRVIVDERTGTIVMGGAVKISPVVVAHGDLSVRISEEQDTSSPVPFGPDSQVTERTEVEAVERKVDVTVIRHQDATIDGLARLLTRLGMTPRGLITILEAIDRAGALHAELVVQ